MLSLNPSESNYGDEINVYIGSKFREFTNDIDYFNQHEDNKNRFDKQKLWYIEFHSTFRT